MPSLCIGSLLYCKMIMIEIAAVTACVILTMLFLFQCALIVGAPLGHFAWGGAHKVLPIKLRIGSALSILLYIVFAITILNSAGVASIVHDDRLVHGAMWVLTAYFFLGVFMNGISRSKKERAIMTPVSLALALLCLFIVIS